MPKLEFARKNTSFFRFVPFRVEKIQDNRFHPLHISKNTFTFAGSFYKQKNGDSIENSYSCSQLLFLKHKANRVEKKQEEKAEKQNCDRFSERTLYAAGRMFSVCSR
jgi:hypothetical protein